MALGAAGAQPHAAGEAGQLVGQAGVLLGHEGQVVAEDHVAGGVAGGVREIYLEGLRLPMVKLVKAGRNVIAVAAIDFGRFGGLWEESCLGYAVADYFVNGGEKAVILRLFNPGTTSPAQPPGRAQIVLLDPQGDEAITLEARHPGAWGGGLRARVTYPEPVDEGPEALFDLVVHDPATGASEEYLNLSVGKDSTRRIDRVLAGKSALVEVKGQWSGDLQRPAEHGPRCREGRIL